MKRKRCIRLKLSIWRKSFFFKRYSISGQSGHTSGWCHMARWRQTRSGDHGRYTMSRDSPYGCQLGLLISASSAAEGVCTAAGTGNSISSSLRTLHRLTVCPYASVSLFASLNPLWGALLRELLKIRCRRVHVACNWAVSALCLNLENFGHIAEFWITWRQPKITINNNDNNNSSIFTLGIKDPVRFWNKKLSWCWQQARRV